MNLHQSFIRYLAVLLSVAVAWNARAASEKEAELLAVLQSDAPKADKALTCKKLAVYGSADAVPELAKLLSDAELASWSRIALEAIPGPEADEALRTSLSELKGLLLIGAINSLGVRHSADSVTALSERLTDAEDNVASAAAVALGHIGNADAAKLLQERLAKAPAGVRSAVAEGYILCAEKALAENRAADAVAIYDEIREAELPRPRIREATRGAILARGDDGIPLLLEQLDSADEDLFQIGLSTAREFPGGKVDAVLVKAMNGAVPLRAALIVQAMADRPETVDLAAVLKAAESGPQPVRLAAIGTLGRIGNATCLSSLLNIALEKDEALVAVAKKTLGDLPGETVDQDIVKRLDSAKGDVYPLLIDLVGERRIAAIPQLLKALDHKEDAVRQATLRSLGSTVPPEKLSVLIEQVVAPKYDDDAPVAELALKTAAVRMPDREVCAEELSAALGKAPAKTKVVLLDILGAVSGTKALNTLALAAKSDDPALQDAASDLIGKWMTIDAAPVLHDLSTSAPADKFRIRSLRGFIRIARQFVMSDEERIAMTKQAYELAKQPNEQKLVLEVLKRYPKPEMLKLAVQATKDFGSLRDEATETALAIAQKLGAKDEQVQELLSDLKLNKVKLEIVKAEYGAGDKQKDVTEALRKHAGDVALISLPSSNFNEVFGEDPAPGSPKKLKIQYRLNDKAGEATFDENSLIILALPK